MKECIKENQCFHLMDRHVNHPLVVKALDLKERSALDIGCGVGTDLFFLYHNYDFKTLIGIEGFSVEMAIFEHISNVKSNSGETVGPYKTLYEIYLKTLKFCPEKDPRDIGKTFMSEEEFLENIPITFNKDGLDYMEELGPSVQFDVIIMSNSLHFNNFNKQKKIVEIAENKLKRGGLIYIKTNHVDNRVKNQHPITETQFNDLTKDFNEIDSCINFMNTNSRIRSLVYFGAKK